MNDYRIESIKVTNQQGKTVELRNEESIQEFYHQIKLGETKTTVATDEFMKDTNAKMELINQLILSKVEAYTNMRREITNSEQRCEKVSRRLQEMSAEKDQIIIQIAEITAKIQGLKHTLSGLYAKQRVLMRDEKAIAKERETWAAAIQLKKKQETEMENVITELRNEREALLLQKQQQMETLPKETSALIRHTEMMRTLEEITHVSKSPRLLETTKKNAT